MAMCLIRGEEMGSIKWMKRLALFRSIDRCSKEAEGKSQGIWIEVKVGEFMWERLMEICFLLLHFSQ